MSAGAPDLRTTVFAPLYQDQTSETSLGGCRVNSHLPCSISLPRLTMSSPISCIILPRISII